MTKKSAIVVLSGEPTAVATILGVSPSGLVSLFGTLQQWHGMTFHVESFSVETTASGSVVKISLVEKP